MPPEAIAVTLLTQPDCTFCDEAKALLARLDNEYPLSVSTREFTSPEGRELAARGGIMFAPGLFLDGEPFSYGRPSERKLRKELERRMDS